MVYNVLKEGIIRQNLLGKRVEQSARSVIGPDPTLKMGEVAVPEVVASQLTIPVTVNSHNIEELMEIVHSGKANFYIKKGGQKRINLKYALNQRGTEVLNGDEVMRNGQIIHIDNDDFILQPGDSLFRDGVKMDVRYPEKRRLKLEYGDIVERHLRDGDYVLINRELKLKNILLNF